MLGAIISGIGFVNKLVGGIKDVGVAKHTARGVIASSWAGMITGLVLLVTYLWITYLVWNGIEAPSGVAFMLAFRNEILMLLGGLWGISVPTMFKGIKIKRKDVEKLSAENATKKQSFKQNNPKPEVKINDGLAILREYKKSYTIGKVYIDGQDTELSTLELPVEYDGVPNVRGKTCIPEGVYKISYLAKTHSGKTYKGLGCYMLSDVPNRSGILIHVGNWLRQIQGCILIGTHIMAGGSIMNSQRGMKQLTQLIKQHRINEIKIVS